MNVLCCFFVFFKPFVRAIELKSAIFIVLQQITAHFLTLEREKKTTNLVFPFTTYLPLSFFFFFSFSLPLPFDPFSSQSIYVIMQPTHNIP